MIILAREDGENTYNSGQQPTVENAVRLFLARAGHQVENDLNPDAAGKALARIVMDASDEVLRNIANGAAPYYPLGQQLDAEDTRRAIVSLLERIREEAATDTMALAA